MRRADLLGFAMGPALTALIGLLSVPLMAWIYSPEDVARFGLFQLAINSVLLIATLGLDQAFVREYNEAGDRYQLLKNCLVPCLAIVSLLAVALLACIQPFTEELYSSTDIRLGLLTVGTTFLLCVHRFSGLLIRMSGRGLLYSTADLATKLTQLGMMLAAAQIQTLRHAAFLMLAYMLSFAVGIAILAFPERSTWRQAMAARVDPHALKHLLAFGAPLVASGLAYWALTAAGSLAIKWVSTLGELAKYSVALSISNAALLLQAVFVLIWTPVVYRWIADGTQLHMLDTVARRLMGFVCLIFSLAGLACGFVNQLLPDHYSQLGQLLPGCLVLPLLYTVSEVTGVGIAATRRTSLSVVVSLSALSVCILINLLLTPQFGAAGATAASAGAGLAFFVTRSELSARIWRSLPRCKLYLCAALLTGASAMPAFWPELTTPTFWLSGSVIVLLAFRKDLTDSFAWLMSHQPRLREGKRTSS
jgi:O-antigen/teichoic acid export membrane protein